MKPLLQDALAARAEGHGIEKGSQIQQDVAGKAVREQANDKSQNVSTHSKTLNCWSLKQKSYRAKKSMENKGIMAGS